MKFLYRLDHIYKLDHHFEYKQIGIFSSEENAQAAIQFIKNKPGFCDYPAGFTIKRRLYCKNPHLLNKVYWADGFDTYNY